MMATRVAVGIVIIACCHGLMSAAAAHGAGLAVSSRSGECQSVAILQLPVGGACEFQGTVDRSAIRLITPLGLLPAAYCDQFDLRLTLDGYGAAWIDRVYLEGGDACGDIKACDVPGTSTQAPWRGAMRMDRGGAIHIRFDVCLDTCFGLFEGTQRFELERVGRSWRLVADNAQVGASAFEVEAEWRLEGSTGMTIERLPG